MVSMAGHEAWQTLRSAVLELRTRRLQVKLLRGRTSAWHSDPRSGKGPGSAEPRLGRNIQHPTSNNQHPMGKSEPPDVNIQHRTTNIQ